VSYGFGLMIEGLVAILLMVTIGYCSILNNRLRRLKADEQLLKATIAELITATEIAERAVSGLKTAARECESALGERLEAAKDCAVELDRQVKAGDGVIERLVRVVTASRKLDDVPAATPADEALGPKAVAAAARSLADRLRGRTGTVAA
jgi:Domain of unknown function (DUF6468)